MGLACNQVAFLTLTRRKNDCELGITIASGRKMQLSREMSDLSADYRAKLNATKVSYYADGKYNQVNYSYLMGYGKNFLPVTSGTAPIKTDGSMILSDYKGAVVLAGDYAGAILSVLGSSAMDSYGRGGTFSSEHIPDMLAYICPGFDAEVFKSVMNGEDVPMEYTADVIQTLGLNDTGADSAIDATDKATALVQKLLDFYLPIFKSASANGWTTEYNTAMNKNPDYVADAIASGTFCLSGTDEEGQYDPSMSTDYYVTCGEFAEKSDAEYREEITAWYNEEKERISEKENFIDIEIQDLSTELEAINTELQSLQSFIDDAISSTFDWGA